MTTLTPQVRDRSVVQNPKLSIRDLFEEMISGLLGRPGRLALTALGTVLGITALVSTLGLAKTAGNQIVSRFDELTETRIVVSPAENGFGGSDATSSIPWNAEVRLVRLNGVEAAGTKSDVDVSGALSRSVPVVDPLGINEHQINVVATSGGLLDAVRGSIRTGRYFDNGHSDRADPVVVLGPAAAQRLNIFRLDTQPAIFIGEQSFTVLGIIDDVSREPDLLNAIVMPDGTAHEFFGLSAPAEVHIDAAVGATTVLANDRMTVTASGTDANMVQITLTPDDPESLRTQASPGYTAVRQDVEGDVNALFVVLGAVSLLVGGLGIANVTLVSVLERTPEIGLRRALGAARRHIAAQFLLESTVTGLLGGIIGASVGVLTIVAVSAVRDWTPVLEGYLPFAAVGLGAVIGLIAGTYPALRAARTEPITALRSS
ncbi:ABC transporter permease [Acidimicrobiales bacterium]|jgi:ABC-type antimicrobial peptide transport system permease subunit|nr:ABC transporter permease [Acidimicrobiales bacterium]MDG1087913.1 ABC transporter permease [Acidimicrobiales bacterium]